MLKQCLKYFLIQLPIGQIPFFCCPPWLLQPAALRNEFQIACIWHGRLVLFHLWTGWKINFVVHRPNRSGMFRFYPWKNRENIVIFTFEKLQPANVWCLHPKNLFQHLAGKVMLSILLNHKNKLTRLLILTICTPCLYFDWLYWL